MKCARVTCKEPMVDRGDGSFVCSIATCGSEVVQWDPAVGDGLTASSKPNNPSGPSRETLLATQRRNNADPARKAKKREQYLAKRYGMSTDEFIAATVGDGQIVEGAA